MRHGGKDNALGALSQRHSCKKRCEYKFDVGDRTGVRPIADWRQGRRWGTAWLPFATERIRDRRKSEFQKAPATEEEYATAGAIHASGRENDHPGAFATWIQ